MAEVIAAILEKNYQEAEKKIKLVENLVKWVQIDIADGILVPNATFTDPSPFKNLTTPLQLEVHLMVNEPVGFVEPFYNNGFRRIFAHVEAEGVDEFLAACYKLDVEVGLAIDGPTQLSKIEAYLDNLDVVLVMAIEAGFSGQPFREDTIDKIKKIKELYFDLPIAVDGAMNEENARKVVEAGATRICSNSYIFNAADIKEAVGKLRAL